MNQGKNVSYSKKEVCMCIYKKEGKGIAFLFFLPPEVLTAKF